MANRIAILSGLLACGLGLAAGAAAAGPSRAEQWAELQTRAELTPDERLREQTRLLTGLEAPEAWRDPPVWDWAQQVLAGWETSSHIAEARQAYLGLLEAIGSALEGAAAETVPDESALREYFRRGLNIVDTPQEEARLLLHMADSWLRDAPDPADPRRRAESLLQQAAALLQDEPPLDAVQFRLGRLHAEWGAAEIGTGPPPEGLSHFSRAVAHLQAVAAVAGADPGLLERAARLLDNLLQPELQLDPPMRFLPQDEVRLTVRARNVAELQVGLVALPGDGGIEPLPLARLREIARALEGDPEQLRFQQTLPVAARAAHDWEVREIRLGEDLGSGWYGVRVTGAGLERRDLLLVSAHLVAALQRLSGEQVLWRVEAETGQPVPQGAYQFLADGGWRGPFFADADGKALVPAASAPGWTEIHALDGADPGLLVRPSRIAPEPARWLPWATANAAGVLPGASFEWCLAGIAPDALERHLSGVRLRFPGMPPQPARARAHGADWMLGAAQAPADLAQPGPVYLELPDGGAILLTHALTPKALPLVLEFSGEQLDSGLNLFLSTAPVTAEILATSGAAVPLPDFVRVRGSAVTRAPGWGVGHPPAADPETRLLFERIVPFNPAEGRGGLLELPLGPLDELLALRVQVLPLEGATVLGDALLGVSPYRSLVRVGLDRRIVRPGQPVGVKVSVWDPQEVQARPVEGHLVVYQERWESRYVHRRRGSLITEEEFQSLPERAMLGLARTDFRLAEQGFVREEVKRQRLVPAREAERVILNLEQPGYYHIAFETRDTEVRAEYPDGLPEVWVIRDEGDAQLLRANRPRLVVEQEPDGSAHLLVLMERPAGSVLVDLQTLDGSGSTRVYRPEGAAIFLQYRPQAAAPLRSARVLVAGERGFDTLDWETDALTRANWSLTTPQQAGYNPGTPFSWILEDAGAAFAGPVFWTFHANAASEFLLQQARWQERLRSPRRLNSNADGMLMLDQWRPLFRPLAAAAVALPDAAPDAGDLDPEAFIALFPELRRSPPALPAPAPLRVVVEAGTDGNRQLAGELPNSAGSWLLTAFGVAPNRPLVWQVWPVSTELPIRMALDGPPLARSGDRARVQLSLENTTRYSVTLQVALDGSGTVALAAIERDWVTLPPGQRTVLPLPLTLAGAGPGQVHARVAGDGLLSEARHELTVPAPHQPGRATCFLVPPGEPAWQVAPDLPDWAGARVVVASGLGWLLPEAWPLLRACHAREPLLTALVDWALWQAVSRHGLPTQGDGPALRRQLAERLEAHQAQGGGWAWSPGFAADPWLSALVLWTVATFAESPAGSFQTSAARAYLESVLISPTQTVALRLFALRALSAREPHAPATRPTRLQARSFLDFLHRRAELDRVQLAMLLEVARLLRFSEEVRLLTTELTQRFPPGKAGAAPRFWTDSLVYLALEEPDRGASRVAQLQAALRALDDNGQQRGWEQLGGFLNLLAVFQAKGEFHVDGSATVAVDGGPPEPVVLDPETDASGLRSWTIAAGRLRAGPVPVAVDSRQARSPVLVALLGEAPPPEPPPLPGFREQWFREFYEETLLAGPVRRFTELAGPSFEACVGDLLEARLSFTLDQPWDNAELVLPVPAGVLLDERAIRHVSDAPDGAPPVQLLPQGPGLERVLRMAPLPAGQHTLILNLTVQWEGDYALPAGRLRHARTGEVYSTGSAGRLRVEPAGN